MADEVNPVIEIFPCVQGGWICRLHGLESIFSLIVILFILFFLYVSQTRLRYALPRNLTWLVYVFGVLIPHYVAFVFFRFYHFMIEYRAWQCADCYFSTFSFIGHGTSSPFDPDILPFYVAIIASPVFVVGFMLVRFIVKTSSSAPRPWLGLKGSDLKIDEPPSVYAKFFAVTLVVLMINMLVYDFLFIGVFVDGLLARLSRL